MDPTNSSFLPSNPWAPVPTDFLSQNAPPAQKAKLLCSFGGKILPRPGDSALRYIGGHTRLISVQKDLNFHEFMRKLSTVITNSTDQEKEPDPISPKILTSVKYQLPGEDLDALVSVSCQEDLENMMEEYDKLSLSCTDGSAKLRVFLFPQTEPDLSLTSIASDDSGQKYISMINNSGPSTEGIKESVASAGSSTHNSENNPLHENLDNLNEIMSPPVQSPAAAYLANMGPAVPDQNSVPVQPVPVGYMTPQGFVETQQIAYLNPPQIAGNLPNNMVPVPVNPFVPPAGPVPVTTTAIPVGPVPVTNTAIPVGPLPVTTTAIPVGPVLVTNTAIPVGPVPVTTTAIPVSPLKPVQVVPAVQPVVQPVQTDSNRYKVLQPLSQLPPLPPVYLQDQYATWTATQIAPQGIRYDDCAMCQKALPHTHSDNMVPELGAHASHMDQTQNPVFYSPHPDCTVKRTSPTVSTNQLPTNPVISNPVVTNPVISNPVKTQPYWSTINPAMYHMILNNNNNANYQNQTAQNYGAEFSPNYHNQPAQNYGAEFPPNYQNEPAQNYGTEFSQNFMQAVTLGPTALPLDPNSQVRPDLNFQPGQIRPMLINPVQQVPAVPVQQVPAVPVQQVPAVPVQQVPAVSVQPVINPQETSLISNNSNNSNNVQYSNNHGSPVYTMDMHDTQFIPVQPVNNANNNVMQHQAVSNTNANTNNNVIQPPKSTGNDSESLFSNHDPWNRIGGNGNLMPPIPTKIAATKDQVLDTNLGFAKGADMVTLSEEGNLPRPDPSAPISKGSGEDSVKRQLQVVAENVAASVLQSSLSGGNNTFDKEGPPCKNDIERVLDAKEEVQEMKNHQLDKVNPPGVPLVDDIVRLQIIKNSDLEELRELGSGTFGTVYHGKWRGTDVAIKRINDRCFAGKPSEQERMRADFWNEACKLASLHHPNVVAFYGLVLDGPGGSVATVTEYMANGSLRQALQRNDKILDRRRRLVIAMDVAFGMEYLHGKNIVHFDLKSDNLLVNLRDPQRPICKVGDLGLSKVKCQTLISGGVRGTLPWMAPELLNGSSSLVSEKVDVFSFGIVMWELLTGDEPYADLHYGAIIGGIVNNTLRPPVPESCDPEWKSLMMKCWSADTSERPNFTEVVNRLRSMATALSHKAAQK